ncbi:MAG TPA: TPM domain-containing protein [Nitrospiraceae bacterium]|nr:TPM domain-containing protein [Nitrospiraceae bacterium]
MRPRSRPASRVLVGWTLCALAIGSAAHALDVPALTGRVVDLAHVLPPSTAAQLSERLQAHEDKTTNQLAVLIVPSLEGEPLFDFSHRVASTWKLGQKGTDNGALLLVAIKDRKVRIEVGYGLEGTLTDARSAQIIRNEIVPRFRAGDYAGGITAGVDAILKTIEGTYTAPERPVGPSPLDDRIGSVLFAVIIGVLIGLALSRVHRFLGAAAGGGISFLAAPWLAPAVVAGLASLALVSLFGVLSQASGGGSRRGRFPADDWISYSSRGGGWGQGGFGGSFGGSGGFSGGGGSFGGGGASGDW